MEFRDEVRVEVKAADWLGPPREGMNLGCSSTSSSNLGGLRLFDKVNEVSSSSKSPGLTMGGLRTRLLVLTRVGSCLWSLLSSSSSCSLALSSGLTRSLGLKSLGLSSS